MAGRIIAVDTETDRFGEQPDGSILIVPPMVCTSWAVRKLDGIQSFLVSDGDGFDMHDQWHEWLTGDDTLVFHNAAFDLAVCCKTFPDLEIAVWDKLERGEITCTKNREKLLNLSTHGNLEYVQLPDGTSENLSYGLDNLVLNYIGEDMSEDKHGEDSVRLSYSLYKGMPSRNYPVEASTYVRKDAHVTLVCYEAQTARRSTTSGHASFHTEFFQTACDFALYLITEVGQRIDKDRVLKLKAQMEEVLSEENLAPMIGAGLLRPAQPLRPYANQLKRALAVMADEFGTSGAIDWTKLTDDQLAVMDGEGIKFKAPGKASLDRKALCARVEAVCKASGTPVKFTPASTPDNPKVCADAEVIQSICSFDTHDESPPREDLEAGDPRGMTPLENYQYRQAVQKIVTTEIPRMMWQDEPAERVHFNYSVLVATGRTSSFASKHYPSGNGQQIDPRGRPCYLPEDNRWLLSTDYSALELCSVAQTTYDLFGYSRHRDLINGGKDLHAYLGASMAARLPSEFEGDLSSLDRNYALFMALKAVEPKFHKHWRGFSKPVGLGYPGGLGANTFMSLAKKSYGVDIMKAAQSFPLDQLPGPENTTVLWHAQRVGVKANDWAWTPFLRGIALAVLLKKIWLETYPEMVAYFEWVTQQKDEHNFHVNDDGDQEHLLCYTTPMGMHRAGGTFTAVANGNGMQSPAAEGAKAAVFRVKQACRIGELRGLAVLHNFIHDELILSVPADPAGAAQVIEIVERLMIDAMQNVMPDVKISVESALMERWFKEADPVHSRASGLLVPCEPGVEYDRDAEGQLWAA